MIKNESLKKFITYLVPPVMIIMTNWLADLVNVNYFYLAIFSFGGYFLLFALVNYINNDKEKKKTSHSQVATYYLLILIVGLLLGNLTQIYIDFIDQPKHHIFKVLIQFLFLAVLFFIHFNSKSSKNKLNIGIWLALIIFTLLLISLYYSLNISAKFETYFNGATLLLAFYSIYVFYLLSQEFIKVRDVEGANIRKKSKELPKKHLIVFLSDCKDNNAIEEFKKHVKDKLPIEEMISKLKVFGGDKKHHPWEINLRAIKKHIDENSDNGLKEVTILASKPSENSEINSMSQAHLLINYLRIICNNKNLNFQTKLLIVTRDGFRIEQMSAACKRHSPNSGLDFNNFNEIVDALEEVIKTSEFNPEEIVIDVTSGPKPVSIAGAIVTTTYPIYNQYIDTNSTKEVHVYNLQYNNSTSI